MIMVADDSDPAKVLAASASVAKAGTDAAEKLALYIWAISVRPPPLQVWV